MYVVSLTEFNLLSKHMFVLFFNIMILPVKAWSTMWWDNPCPFIKCLG